MIAHVTAASLASREQVAGAPGQRGQPADQREPGRPRVDGHLRRAPAAADDRQRRAHPRHRAARRGAGHRLPAAAAQFRRAGSGACAAARALPGDGAGPLPRARHRGGHRTGVATARWRASCELRCARPARAVDIRPESSTHDQESPHEEARLPACLSPPPRLLAGAAMAQETKVADRHVRLDRLRAADAGQGSRPVQEARPGRDDQEDPAEGPPPGDRLAATSSARRPRSRPGSSGTPTASPRRRSSSSTRATAPTAWWSSRASPRSAT